MSFVHLHTHSHYSLLDGLPKIDELVEKAVAEKMPALALTDHGNMYGAVEFYQKCKKAGIKPIIGMEAYVVDSRTVKSTNADEKRYSHLILLAKNKEGYKNLLKIVSISNLEGFYYKPRIDFEVLERHHEGLIASSACLAGQIPRAILSSGEEKARELIAKYLNLFGRDNFYLEVQHHPSLEGQATVNNVLYKLGKEMDVPVIATNDIHYVNAEDAEAQDTLLCIQTNRKVSERDRMTMLGENYSFRSVDEMQMIFAAHPEVLENTVKLADKINFELELGNIKLPSYELPEGVTADGELRKLCEEGLLKRFPEIVQDEAKKKQVLERLDYELSVITKTGYATYFLIVQDFVNWALKQGIAVGPGRGSAAGSIVAYLTNITNVDPLKYDLLFERFLNPERISMPDIDLDFADVRRDEVIRYVEGKYGHDHVAQIITFGTMAARGAIRDAGRALDMPYTFCDKVAKMVPQGNTLQEAVNISPELKGFYNDNFDCKRLISAAKKLEGVARHASTHACGVLITKEPLSENVPVQYSTSGDNVIVSQYSLKPIEDLGLLKMDFLGLAYLTIIENSLKIINKIHGIKIDINNIPLDDKKTFRLLQKGQTTGVFQLESSGMKRYLKQMKPTDIEDIIAMVALYRPGPMDLIPEYIANKHGLKIPTYLHPKLKPILEKTNGIAIYQEQLMEIARALAGFSLGEADVLRKAVGKKIPELLAKQRDKFISRCVDNKVSREVATRVFEFIEPFAGYGFNRSHAACYAMIAYQTAYLKAHYPAEFMASLLTSEGGNLDRIAIEVAECKEMGIEVLPPSINESFSTFTVVAESLKEGKPRIRFGLKAIKNVGENIADCIIAERSKNGKFETMEDVLTRVQDKDLNKKSLESLAKSGALDSLGERNQILENIERILMFIKQTQREAQNGQSSLFGGLIAPGAKQTGSLKLNPARMATKKELLSWEKELLGLYVTEHPFSEFETHLSKIITKCADTRECSGNVKVAGVISKIKKIITKAGEMMYFATIEDTSGSLEILVFPKTLKETAAMWEEEKIVLIEGKLSDKDGVPKVLAEKVKLLDIEKMKKQVVAPVQNSGSSIVAASVSIKLTNLQNNELNQKLKTIFDAHPGVFPVILVVQNGGEPKKIQTKTKIDFNDIIKKEIEELVGEGRVNKI